MSDAHCYTNSLRVWMIEMIFGLACFAVSQLGVSKIQNMFGRTRRLNSCSTYLNNTLVEVNRKTCLQSRPDLSLRSHEQKQEQRS